jgi:fibronectin-binding autotransporter adhesin
LGAAKTWDGGANPSGNWSSPANWDADTAPAATGDTLTFGGTIGLAATNDSVAALSTSGTALTFASGAGSFVLRGNAVTMGSGGGAGQVIIQQNSANPQEINFPITLSGGNGDRSIVFGAGAGSLTLSGNINFGTANGDWLFPNTAAGTIILSGNNTGDGKATAALTAGANVLRTMLRNNVAGTTLTLGSDTCLGNSGSGSISAGSAAFRGIVANQQLNINTTGGNRNLSGSTLEINANNITFNGANNLTIGNIINHAGNRDFVVSSTGQVTVQDGICLSGDQTGRNLFVNLSGAGGLVVNGKIFDTFHSGGVTTGVSALRKAGTGTMTLNGNSTYTGVTTIEAGTLKIGHASALGATGVSSGTFLSGNATLDLNGFTIGETITNNNSGNSIINSSATAAGITADINVNADLTLNATGDLTLTRLISSAVRTYTKVGTGTVTTSGTSHNNLAAWAINNGSVVFANTSGYGADRGVTIGGGTLKLSGANTDLVNDNQSFTLNSGVFDLNGKAEAVAAIGGTGGFVRNTAVSTATLYVGGGVSGTSSASYAGVVENGTGTLNVTKEGSGTQTLTGANTYSGNTTISAGTLALSGSGSIASSLNLTVAKTAKFDVSAITPTGYSLPAGTLTIGIDKTSGVLTQGQVVIVGKNLAYAGSLTVSKTGADALSIGDSFTLVATTTGSLSGWFSALSLPTLSNGLTWDTNHLATAGYLDVYDFRTNALQTMVALKNTATTLKISKLTGKTAGSRGTVGVQSVNSGSGATVGISGADMTYTPPPDFTGTDTFTVILGDGHSSITATVVVTVSEANVGPALAVDNGYQTNGGYGSFTASGLPNMTYEVEVATNPGGPWLPADNDTVAATGAGFISYTDTKTISAYGGTVFYRLRQQ